MNRTLPCVRSSVRTAAPPGTDPPVRSLDDCSDGAALTRDHVGGVPPGPVVLRSRRFVLPVVHLGFPQKLGQRRDVLATGSSSLYPRFNLLQEPGVAVRIGERRKCLVGVTVRVRPRRGGLAERGEMERGA